MNNRLYFLSFCLFISACVPTQEPMQDVFIQSELMPPKGEEIIVAEEKTNSQESILSEILAAIKSPTVSKQEEVKPAPQPVAQPAPQQTPPPVVLPQTSATLPQILQAAPNGGGSAPFFQTIVIPQAAPYPYPTAIPQAAPFYSTPTPQQQTYAPQAPAANLPVQAVNEPAPQPATVQQMQPQQPAIPMMPQPTNIMPNDMYYQTQEYQNYQAGNLLPQNGYSAQTSSEVILPDTYQLPETQQPIGHVMSGQAAYPVWQSEETFFEETIPVANPQTPSPLNSENINIPRW